MQIAGLYRLPGRMMDTAALRLRGRGYRFRIYLFAGLTVLLVLSSLALSLGLVWHSKKTTTLIVEKDLKIKETERAMIDLILSMDRNRKKFFLLHKPEYKALYVEDAEQFRRHLEGLESLELSDEEKQILATITARFEAYFAGDPFSPRVDVSDAEILVELPFEEVNKLLRLNQDRMELRIREINDLTGKTIQVGGFWAGLALLAAALSSFLLIRSITRPIDLLQEGTKKIAEGKFTHRVDLPTSDELGQLAGAFNEMAEQLKRLDDMKAEFIAIVSHDLKTPLTSMKEAVDLLLEGAVGLVNPKQRRLLEINAASVERLILFVDDLLNFTRMEGGMVPLYPTRLDFQRLIEEKLSGFRLLADKCNIELSASYFPAAFPPVYGDAERLKQVIDNLLSNALNHTPWGGSISLRAAYLTSGRNRGQCAGTVQTHSKGCDCVLRVEVTDTGTGIPPWEWKRVFDKFHQIQKESNRGSGLGLAIARMVVEGHGGAIWVEKSSNKGTTFVFEIPQDGKQEGKEDGNRNSSARVAPNGLILDGRPQPRIIRMEGL